MNYYRLQEATLKNIAFGFGHVMTCEEARDLLDEA